MKLPESHSSSLIQERIEIIKRNYVKMKEENNTELLFSNISHLRISNSKFKITRKQIIQKVKFLLLSPPFPIHHSFSTISIRVAQKLEKIRNERLSCDFPQRLAEVMVGLPRTG